MTGGKGADDLAPARRGGIPRPPGNAGDLRRSRSRGAPRTPPTAAYPGWEAAAGRQHERVIAELAALDKKVGVNRNLGDGGVGVIAQYMPFTVSLARAAARAADEAMFGRGRRAAAAENRRGRLR
jgi:hypothetical protein